MSKFIEHDNININLELLLRNKDFRKLDKIYTAFIGKSYIDDATKDLMDRKEELNPFTKKGLCYGQNAILDQIDDDVEYSEYKEDDLTTDDFIAFHLDTIINSLYEPIDDFYTYMMDLNTVDMSKIHY